MSLQAHKDKYVQKLAKITKATAQKGRPDRAEMSKLSWALQYVTICDNVHRNRFHESLYLTIVAGLMCNAPAAQ